MNTAVNQGAGTSKLEEEIFHDLPAWSKSRRSNESSIVPKRPDNSNNGQKNKDSSLDGTRPACSEDKGNRGLALLLIG